VKSLLCEIDVCVRHATIRIYLHPLSLDPAFDRPMLSDELSRLRGVRLPALGLLEIVEEDLGGGPGGILLFSSGDGLVRRGALNLLDGGLGVVENRSAPTEVVRRRALEGVASAEVVRCRALKGVRPTLPDVKRDGEFIVPGFIGSPTDR